MIVGVGIGTRSQTTFRVPAVMTKDAYVTGFNTGNLLPKLPELIRRLTPLLREGSLKVFVDRAMPFEQANEAHEIVRSGKFLGKVILTP
jgi:NADPH:quinone reductase-like Zn-dependent oxidoreductase